MTYIQSVDHWRTIRADVDRLKRLIKSPRVSQAFKVGATLELAALQGMCEDARQAALAKMPVPGRKEVA